MLFFHVTTPCLQKEIKKTINFKKEKINSLIHVSEMIEPPYECITKRFQLEIADCKYVTNRKILKNIILLQVQCIIYKKFFLKV